MTETEQNKSPVCEEDERDKANQTLQELIEVFRGKNLRQQDIVAVYGNLGYALGASIDGVKEGEDGPGFEEVQQRYYTNPTLSVALMMQGLIITSWYDQVSKGMTLESIKETDNNE